MEEEFDKEEEYIKWVLTFILSNSYLMRHDKMGFLLEIFGVYY